MLPAGVGRSRCGHGVYGDRLPAQCPPGCCTCFPSPFGGLLDLDPPERLPVVPTNVGCALGTAGTVGRLIILPDGENGVDGFY